MHLISRFYLEISCSFSPPNFWRSLILKFFIMWWNYHKFLNKITCYILWFYSCPPSSSDAHFFNTFISCIISCVKLKYIYIVFQIFTKSRFVSCKFHHLRAYSILNISVSEQNSVKQPISRYILVESVAIWIPSGQATGVLAGVIYTYIPRDQYTRQSFWHSDPNQLIFMQLERNVFF